MSKIVDCFVVGHWALSHKKLTERHVSGHITNLDELYETLVQTFLKGGDLVLDIGSENGKFCFSHFIHILN